MAKQASNPFMFDAEKMAEMFKVPGMDKWLQQANAPFELMMETQRKNFEALVEANKVAASGYQDLYERMVGIFEESLGRAKAQVERVQGQEVSAEAAAKNAEVMKEAFDKALADVRELSEMAQKANAGAFDVIRARTEEAIDEFRGAAEKIAA